MGNLVKFKPNMDYYYTRGLSAYERDDFVGAIREFRAAYAYVDPSEPELSALLEVEMGCAYRNLNLTAQAQLMFYKAVAHSKLDAAFDSLLGLIDIFGLREEDEALRYYMDIAAKRGYSRELDFIEATTQFYSRREYKVEPAPERNMLELGKKLLETGQYEFARQLLSTVPEDSPAYAETCSVLSALCNTSGDYEKALDYARTAIECGAGLEARLNELLALYKSGKGEAYDEALVDIYSYETDDVSAIERIIRAAALVNEAELLKKFGRKMAAISPRRTPMLSYAVALANSGALREARKIMVDLQALYPYDAVISVYAVLLSRAFVATDFPLSGELPASAESEILDSLNGVLAEYDGNKSGLRARLKDEELRTGILMISQVGSDNSKRILCELTADIPYFERYYRDCLMDPAYPDSDKRIVLPIAVKKFRARPLYLTTRDICRPLFGKPPAYTVGKWRDAYALAYGTLALFGCENFEKQFGAVFADLREALGGESNLDDLALAALIANRTGEISALRDDECCVELFGADRDTYFDYKNKLPKRKPRKRGGVPAGGMYTRRRDDDSGE